jgi:toxin ParE1/3/4
VRDVRQLRFTPAAGAIWLKSLITSQTHPAVRKPLDDLRQSVETQCANLARLPSTLGRPRPELRPDVRSFPFKGSGQGFESLRTRQ